MEIVTHEEGGENFAGVIRIEEGKIRSHVDQVVRETVEQTVNGLLGRTVCPQWSCATHDVKNPARAHALR